MTHQEIYVFVDKFKFNLYELLEWMFMCFCFEKERCQWYIVWFWNMYKCSSWEVSMKNYVYYLPIACPVTYTYVVKSNQSSNSGLNCKATSPFT